MTKGLKKLVTGKPQVRLASGGKDYIPDNKKPARIYKLKHLGEIK